MITLEQIQNKIAEAIKQSGMTQTAIANALNIEPTQICSYIKGKKCLSLLRLHIYASRWIQTRITFCVNNAEFPKVCNRKAQNDRYPSPCAKFVDISSSLRGINAEAIQTLRLRIASGLLLTSRVALVPPKESDSQKGGALRSSQ